MVVCGQCVLVVNICYQSTKVRTSRNSQRGSYCAEANRYWKSFKWRHAHNNKIYIILLQNSLDKKSCGIVVVTMPPPSLPLLEGLYARQEACSEILRDALARHESARKIARWASASLLQDSSTSYQLKHKKRKLEHKKKKIKKKKKRDDLHQLIVSSNSMSWEHWIFQSLLSPHLRVRQAASAVLLRGPRHPMREALVSFAHRHTTCHGDVQIFGLIKHFLLGDEESFVASGGLRWLTRSIMNLVMILHPSHTRGKPSSLVFQSDTALEALQTRTILLVDLCYHLVLVAPLENETSLQSNNESPNKKRKRASSSVAHNTESIEEPPSNRLSVLRRLHHILWTSSIPSVHVDENPLCPLACLITAHSVLNDHSPLPAQIKGMEACVTKLRNLIHPGVTATIREDTNKLNHGRRAHSNIAQTTESDRDQRIASLLLEVNSAGRHTSAAAAVARAVATSRVRRQDRNSVENELMAGFDVDEDAEEDAEGDDQRHNEAEQENEHHADDDDDDDEEGHESDDSSQYGDEKNDVDDEIDSGLDEGGDDDDDDEVDENRMDIVQDEDEDDDEVDVVREFEDRLLDDFQENDLHRSEFTERSRSVQSQITVSTSSDDEKKRFLILATMQALFAQHAAFLLRSPLETGSFQPSGNRLLSITSEQMLLKTICNVVKPPKKPSTLKIFMRRAPSQEEFFRGSLSRNPIQVAALTVDSNSTSTTDDNDPTVRDLRRFIANDLQMAESAEMLEILVGNKILNIDLKLRVVHQVVWRNHLMENSSTVLPSSLLSGQSAPSFFSTGSGLSMVFSSSLGERSTGRNSITVDTPASALPPMVVTYRLVGVDGEATEDHVEQLNDPEAPSASTSLDERERLMDKKFGLTRLVTDGRGISVLLRSTQMHVRDILRRIRRDEVKLRTLKKGKRLDRNQSLAEFMKSPPGYGLILLRHSCQLASNRKKLVDARAPTILLRLLLNILNTIDEPSDKSTAADQSATVVNNPTADLIEELIETLASDISTDDETSEDDIENDQGTSTLPLLLSSLRTIYLGPPLRKVISKLLPFLTYGQVSLSRELAEHFVAHVVVDKLADCGEGIQATSHGFIIMDTFVQAAINLPPNDVCHTLRSELLKCEFVQGIVFFVLQGFPSGPPPWTAALWLKHASTKKEEAKKAQLEADWRKYFQRKGVKTAFDMLRGLAKGHEATQSLIAGVTFGEEDCERSFLEACHWIESTSDNKMSQIYTNGMGLLAETIIDELKEGNELVSKEVFAIRRRTKDRKKEIAEERRSKALVSLSAHGPLAGNLATGSNIPIDASIPSRSTSLLSPVFDFFAAPSLATSVDSASYTRPSKKKGKKSEANQPAWMAEMEALQDEEGLTCAVCQEGRVLQPSELLGLYAYVKKVTVQPNKCVSGDNIEGVMLLVSLPSVLPPSLADSIVDLDWFGSARIAADAIRKSSSQSASLSSTPPNRRPPQFTTTVSAGNAIHCSCHTNARNADRAHAKAPKSEWEGASLRNSRVSCNIILPLVSSESSKVPLVAVDMALTEYQTTISNLLGTRPKSMLWIVLHDVRLLLLRVAYGESLSVDCGGGSLGSNTALMFYQLFMADMFAKDAEHDAPDVASHARALSGGFLVASRILVATDYHGLKSASATSLARGIADSAPMAGLCCILFNNTKCDASNQNKVEKTPHAERRWVTEKKYFLHGLIACAGRRHALGADDSGCLSLKRGSTRATKATAFTAWKSFNHSEFETTTQRSSHCNNSLPEIEEIALSLRPMITLYAIFDTLSTVFVVNMSDELVDQSVLHIVKKVEDCQRTKNIHDLLVVANVEMEHVQILEEFQKGILTA